MLVLTVALMMVVVLVATAGTAMAATDKEQKALEKAADFFADGKPKQAVNFLIKGGNPCDVC
jgi:hypothetical protein